MNQLDTALATRLFELRARIVGNFTAERWEEVGILTNCTDLIEGHGRLLRSLSWNDNDYSGNVLTVLRQIGERNPQLLSTIERYLDGDVSGGGEYVSALPAQRTITFSPNVFKVPEGTIDPTLVAVMMPFRREFDEVYASIQRVCQDCGLRCLRADGLWRESVIVQDIFNLIFQAQVVIVDFTGRNPNVMYETGIAHTLGKHVVPITQSMDDVPFDMTHHRVAKYLPNSEGLSRLEATLKERLGQLAPSPDPF
jgi:hypothetical protein